MTLDRNQVPDTQDRRGRLLFPVWIKEGWVNSVVNDGGAHVRNINYLRTHFFADTDHGGGGFINLFRNSLAPLSDEWTSLPS